MGQSAASDNYYMVKKVVVWEFDGPIHYWGAYRDDNTRIVLSASRPEGASTASSVDIVVTNATFLQLTLQILAANAVESVVISNRLYFEYDEGQNVRANDMYRALDQCFGPDRNFLTQATSSWLASLVHTDRLLAHKVSFLMKIQQKYAVAADNLLLVDVPAEQRAQIEDVGYRYVHANRDLHSREEGFNSVQDFSYLFEVLFRTLRTLDIYRTLATMPQTATLQLFKKTLLDYQLDNLFAVHGMQVEMRGGKACEHLSKAEDYEKVAKNMLLCIQQTIFETDWNVGFCGGKRAFNFNTGDAHTIPTAMRAILNTIETVERDCWSTALQEVVSLGKYAALRPKQGYFHRRSDVAQQFYHSFLTKDYMAMVNDQVNKHFQQLDRQEEKESRGSEDKLKASRLEEAKRQEIAQRLSHWGRVSPKQRDVAGTPDTPPHFLRFTP